MEKPMTLQGLEAERKKYHNEMRAAEHGTVEYRVAYEMWIRAMEKHERALRGAA